MSVPPLRLVICGLSITSSWGNGHATTYRALVRELARRGHEVLFLERDVPWYAEHRDLPRPPYGRTELYEDVNELRARFGEEVRTADLVMIGSYVPEGVRVAEEILRMADGVTAFYDIDTPITLRKLASDDDEYLSASLVSRFDVYLSFSGGKALSILEREYGARRAIHLPCGVDAEAYRPTGGPSRWALGYLGTYSPDRQPKLERLMLEPARALSSERFAVAGPQYPADVRWPDNVARIDHLPPDRHPAFYGGQRFTLNLTREEMVRLGHSPSVRLFEAAACGTPAISDWWEGLDDYFEPGREILIAESADEVCRLLRDLPETERGAIGRRARARALRDHTAARRAEALEAMGRSLARNEGAERSRSARAVHP